MDVKPPFSRPVKEYSLESYVSDEDGREVQDYKITWKYNANNKISEVQNYDSNNELSDVSCYTYDNDQNLMGVTVKTADGSRKKSLFYEYKENKLFQITETSADFAIVTRFDDYGNIIEKHNLGDTGLPFSTTKYINLYDQNDRLIEKHTVFPSGDTVWVEKYKYNNEGLLIEEQRIRHQITSIVNYSYNDKGDLILTECNPDKINSETLKCEIIYDENDDIVEIKEYRKGWCYQDRNDEFGLTGIARYSYVR